MSDGSSTVDSGRRNALIATSVVGAAGAACVAVPFVATFQPSDKARAAGAPVEVDVSALRAGEMVVAEWRGKPVWILRRTPEMLATLKATDPLVADPNSERTAFPTPEYAKNQARSRKPEFLVAVGICSHLGCSPIKKFEQGDASISSDWTGGFLCPCHGSTFDLAGRVYKNKPAPDNLEVPRHMFVSDTKLLIGQDEKGEA
ncbi:MAG: ubiquinol-cytochrome c reductase iron-sulfur subunit [Burkholderiaceae bacterium]